MKIEFFDKKTGEAVKNQEEYVIDGYNHIYQTEWMSPHYEFHQVPHIGWRIKEEIEK